MGFDTGRLRRSAPAIASVGVVALLAAGQANGGGNQPAAGRSEPHAKVRISNFKFKPFKLTVARSAEVTFVNRDSAAHEPSKKGSFDTGLIAPGKSESVRFSRPGTYRYVCSNHPFMHGKIVVLR